MCRKRFLLRDVRTFLDVCLFSKMVFVGSVERYLEARRMATVRPTAAQEAWRTTRRTRGKRNATGGRVRQRRDWTSAGRHVSAVNPVFRRPCCFFRRVRVFTRQTTTAFSPNRRACRFSTVCSRTGAKENKPHLNGSFFTVTCYALRPHRFHRKSHWPLNRNVGIDYLWRGESWLLIIYTSNSRVIVRVIVYTSNKKKTIILSQSWILKKI